MLWDSGSQLSLITFETAKRLGLKGKPVKLGLSGVLDKSSSVDSRLYQLQALTDQGNKHIIEAFGVERISSIVDNVNLSDIAKMFNVATDDIKRPQGGEIEVLIGLEVAGLHPTRIQAKDHLLLMQNVFGKVVSGSHGLSKSEGRISQACLQVRNAVVLHSVEHGIEKFFEVESIGVNCNLKCGSCKCGQCQPGGKDMSLKDEAEYKMIEKGISFDSNRKKWVASYPWTTSPEKLPNNRHIAVATMKSTERRLMKDPTHADLYNKQIEDMVKRGAARKVSLEELNNYKGPVYYIAHFEVMNPKSRSTPCRIVFNSSAKFRGLSLNDYLAKGPSMLNKLLGVLIRFREGRHAFIGDIAKMYHSVDIGLTEQMTHLFLWRNLNCQAEPTTYAITAVNMGDKPSATIAQVALRKAAERMTPCLKEAAAVIVEDTYMDDITASTASPAESEKLMNDIDEIMKENGFRVKEWVSSGSQREAVSLKTEGQVNGTSEVKERVLGIQWEPGSDVLEFEMKLTRNSDALTKRGMLSVIMKIFDPLGLLTPVTMNFKKMVRRVWASEKKWEWDDELPSEMQLEWRNTMEDMCRMEKVMFPRSITPETTIGDPILVIFSDASIEAYGAVAYARWPAGENQFQAHIIAAKSRMAPIKTIDIVRLELCGAVLSARLRATIMKESRLEFTKVVHLVDSEIVKAMIQKGSYGFNTFAANRVGEIQHTTQKNEWYWIPGKPDINVADVTTRGCAPVDVSSSLWQEGPEFLKLPEKDWPTKGTVAEDIPLPERKQKFVGVVKDQQAETLLGRVDLARFSKWRLLVHVTARVSLLYKRFKQPPVRHSTEPEMIDLMEAESSWIVIAQNELKMEELKKFRPCKENGIIYVGGRTERWMEATWNRQKFILLPKDHPISVLIARHMHEEGGHLGIAGSIAKVRGRFWILGLARMMRSIVATCVKCKKKLLKTNEQVMSPLPVERLQPCPPFTNVCIDYFGPFQTKGEVQKRVRGKAYGVLLTCMTLRAVYADVAADQTTDGFIQVLRRFAARHGWPKKFYSDGGTQLVGAAKELLSILDKEQVQKFGQGKTEFEWRFSPADAPWYNGTAEALVKTTKRALECAIGETVLTFSELQTCMMEAAQLVNQRPIGKTPSDPDEGSYLCPNDLILGRSSSSIPQGEFKERSSNKHRLDFIQSLTSAFWKRWIREVFPNLVIQPKWHTERRNVQVGDVVLVQDSNTVRGHWKMALVTGVVPSEDGKVRRVKLMYRVEATNSKQEVERAVQRLIVLVPKDAEDCGAECFVSTKTIVYPSPTENKLTSKK